MVVIQLLIRLVVICSCLLVVGSFSSCSKNWGEKPAQTPIVNLQESQKTCQAPIEILKGDDTVSKSVIDCWSQEIDSAFTKIEGSEPNAITVKELEVLVKKGTIKLSGNIPQDLIDLQSIQKILGIENIITRDLARGWFNWIRIERVSLRYIYKKLFLKQGNLKFDDIKMAGSVVGSFLNKVNWTYSTDEIAHIARSVLRLQDLDYLRALTPALKLGRNLIAMFCPIDKGSDVRQVWASNEIAKCTVGVLDLVEPGTDWFEYLLNPTNSVPARDKIVLSMNRFYAVISTWLTNPDLKPLKVDRWIEISQALGARVSTDFKGGLEWVKRLPGSLSTEDELHPTSWSRILRVGMRMQEQVFNSMSYFFDDSFVNSKCNRSKIKWTECELKNPNLIRKKDKGIDLALKVKNLNYANSSSPLNGYNLSMIYLFNSISEEVISILDQNDNDGIISVDLGRDDDEVLQLIQFALKFIDNVERVVSNVRDKLNGLPVKEKGTLLDYRTIDLVGFSKLVALSSNILVLRDKEERSIFEKLLDNLFHVFPKTSLFLDGLAITAVIYTADMVGDIRRNMLGIDKFGNIINPKSLVFVSNQNTGEMWVEETSFFEHLETILETSFPRTLRSCGEFGFSWSCKIAFQEILPNPKEKPGFIAIGDIDVIVIAAAAIEGALDSCDRDRDGKLTATVLDGNDELDCGFTRFKDGVKRLFDSKIVTINGGGEGGIKFALDALDGIFATRVLGKAALVAGRNIDSSLINLPGYIFNTSATLGSMYGLLSDAADPKGVQREKVKDRENRRRR